MFGAYELTMGQAGNLINIRNNYLIMLAAFALVSAQPQNLEHEMSITHGF